MHQQKGVDHNKATQSHSLMLGLQTRKNHSEKQGEEYPQSKEEIGHQTPLYHL